MEDDLLPATKVNIKVSTRGEFDPWFTVWLINPYDEEDEIDVIFEDSDLNPCLRFCQENNYEIVSGPSHP